MNILARIATSLLFISISGCSADIHNRVEQLTSQVLAGTERDNPAPTFRAVGGAPADEPTAENCSADPPSIERQLSASERPEDRVRKDEAYLQSKVEGLSPAELVYLSDQQQGTGQSDAVEVADLKASFMKDAATSDDTRRSLISEIDQMRAARRRDPDAWLNETAGKGVTGAVMEDDAAKSDELPESVRTIGKLILSAADPCIGKSVGSVKEKQLASLGTAANGLALHAMTAYRRTLNAADTTAPSSGIHGPNPVSDKSNALLMYAVAFYQGKFVDHFGNSVTAPKLSDTVSDTTLSGATQVLVEWLADDLLATPLFYGVNGSTATFYPSGGTTSTTSASSAQKTTVSKGGSVSRGAQPASGGTTSTTTDKLPTATRWTAITTTPVVADADACKNAPLPPAANATRAVQTAYNKALAAYNESVLAATAGMTQQKLEIVQYGADEIGSGVAHWTGGIFDSFGGGTLGVAVANVKLSIGDNKTLGILAKTAVETAARRVAEDLLVKGLENVDLSKLDDELKNIFPCQYL